MLKTKLRKKPKEIPTQEEKYNLFLRGMPKESVRWLKDYAFSKNKTISQVVDGWIKDTQ